MYKRQGLGWAEAIDATFPPGSVTGAPKIAACSVIDELETCLLYTSDAADERSSVDLGGRRIIKKKNKRQVRTARTDDQEKRSGEISTNDTQSK